MPRRTTLSRLILCVCGALGVSCTAAFAQVQPANPSFSGTVDQGLLTHDFGTFRQGFRGATYNFAVFNRPAPMGTTSAMSLVNVQSLGYTSSMVLQTGTVNGLAAGGQAPMHLDMNTNLPGNLSVSYILDFKNDALPADPHKLLAITGYVKVLHYGDYDSDGDVDNADYALWRSTLGTNNTATDGNLNGVVDAADYVLWRNNFTGPVGSGDSTGAGLSVSLAVPEPTSLAVVAVGLALACLTRGRLRP